MNYYNENDPAAAHCIRALIADGVIAPGDVDERSIIEVKPDDVRGYTQCHFFAGGSVWQLALRQAGWPDDRPVWTGSCPCFPAGTLIVTHRGMIPIEDVVVGDLVCTHKNRWRPVTAIGNEENRDCVVVKGQGHYGLTCTPNHPFLSGDDWIPAKDMEKRPWGNVCRLPRVPIDPFIPHVKGYFYDNHSNGFRVKGELNGKPVYIGIYMCESEAIEARNKAVRSGRIQTKGANAIQVDSDEFARFLGRWCGDGWVTGNNVVLCGGRDEAATIEKIMRDAAMSACVSNERTGPRAKCGSKALVEWLKRNFGSGAAGKRMPVWLYSMPEEYRVAFYKGYLSADGCKANGVARITTISKQLAIGTRILVNTLGLSATIEKTIRPKTTVIEGRTVNQNNTYRVSVYDSARSFSFSGGFGWGRVRSVKKTNKQKVYNFSVNEDESYIADGIAVHNCQPFSAAGKQQGIDDPRHLWPHLYRLIREVRPDECFGEQVSGKAGYAWLDGICDDLEAEGYTCGAADIAACAVDAPHQRSRLWWYGSLANSVSCGQYRQRLSEVRGANISSASRANGSEQTTERQMAQSNQLNGRAGTGRKDRPQAGNSHGATPDTVGVKRRGREQSIIANNEKLLADTNNQGLEGHGECDIPTQRRQEPTGSSANANDSYWGNHWIECYDGKARRTEPSIFFLVDGIQLPLDAIGSEGTTDLQETFPKNRIEAWRIAGNAIVPQLAVEFIKSVAN